MWPSTRKLNDLNRWMKFETQVYRVLTTLLCLCEMGVLYLMYRGVVEDFSASFYLSIGFTLCIVGLIKYVHRECQSSIKNYLLERQSIVDNQLPIDHARKATRLYGEEWKDIYTDPPWDDTTED